MSSVALGMNRTRRRHRPRAAATPPTKPASTERFPLLKTLAGVIFAAAFVWGLFSIYVAAHLGQSGGPDAIVLVFGALFVGAVGVVVAMAVSEAISLGLAIESNTRKGAAASEALLRELLKGEAPEE